MMSYKYVFHFFFILKNKFLFFILKKQYLCKLMLHFSVGMMYLIVQLQLLPLQAAHKSLEFLIEY